MGQANLQVEMERCFHYSAYKPIHEYMIEIVPYLIQRQEIAKKFIGMSNRSSETENNAIEIMRNLDSRIDSILDFMPKDSDKPNK